MVDVVVGEQDRSDPLVTDVGLREAVEGAGLDTNRWYQRNDLVNSGNVYFCATGITTGLLFDGVERGPIFERTQTMLVGPTGERQILTTYHPRFGQAPNTGD